MRSSSQRSNGLLRKNEGSSSRRIIESKLVISHITVALLAFYGGLLLDMTKECPTTCHRVLQQIELPPVATAAATMCPPTSCEQRAVENEEKVCPPCQCQQQQQQAMMQKEEKPCTPCPSQNTQQSSLLLQQQKSAIAARDMSEQRKTQNNVNHHVIMPKTMNQVFTKMGRVNREAFAKAYDVGVPLSPSTDGNQDVLILYGSESVPSELNSSSSSFVTTSDGIPLLSSPKAAMENCITMKMVLVRPDENDQCLAIMGQWPSYHVHKFMRLNEEVVADNISPPVVAAKGEKLVSLDNPLRYTSKTQSAYDAIDVPLKVFTDLSYDWLVEYITRMKEVIETLRPIAQAVAGTNRGNTIIVMICNHGQSELFINFVCSARRRKLDTSQILLFATDLETKELADSLGIATFYDKKIFGKMPKNAANVYGDMDFSRMMLAKVYCVHLINMLEYNVLFQDVDVLWHRHPLQLFLAPEAGDFDMYFQDDGARITRYEPYSPNTGFYFVRYNKRTFYFMSCLIRMGDKIVGTGSQQVALNALLGDHASLYGLKIKVFNREEDLFPGGFHYHRRAQFMKDYAVGKVHPYIFHMSWTANKDNKRRYLEQMGDFLVKDQCIDKSIGEMRNISANHPHDLASACCWDEGPITCHYRDKPSKIPCQDSSPVDPGMPSFW